MAFYDTCFKLKIRRFGKQNYWSDSRDGVCSSGFQSMRSSLIKLRTCMKLASEAALGFLAREAVPMVSAVLNSVGMFS